GPAAPLEIAEEPALGLHADARAGLLERREELPEVVAIERALDGQRALTHGGQADVEGEGRERARTVEVEPPEPRRGQHDRVEVALVEPAETRLDVAAQRVDLEVRTARLELRFAPEGRGPDAR